MAHNVEPMDIDNIESDFDNKENSIHHSNVYPRTPCTEKGYEELDVSELNMKLRYSITPASSPMSKSFTANCNDYKNPESGDDNVNSNLTRSLHSAIPNRDVLNKPVKQLPLQTILSEQFVDSNRNASVLRPLDTTSAIDSNVTVTVTEQNNVDEVMSLLSSSSSTAQTPEATTPTKDIPRNDGGSPIMRGLKSVLNMFRSSQSPIPPAECSDGTKQVLSPAEETGITPDSSLQPATSAVLASTPIAANKHKESNLSKRSSPLKESIVFNEDLEKKLLWKDETTILFSEEKIPIHKLFFQQGSIKDTAKTTEGNKIEFDTDLNSTVEYMDISCNDSVIKNKTMTELKVDAVLANESDAEFLDCETTFTNDKKEVDVAGPVDNSNQSNLTSTVTEMVSALNADNSIIKTDIIVKAEIPLVAEDVPVAESQEHNVSLGTETIDIPQVSEPEKEENKNLFTNTTEIITDIKQEFNDTNTSVNIKNDVTITETNTRSEMNSPMNSTFDEPNISSIVDVSKPLPPEKDITFQAKETPADVKTTPPTNFTENLQEKTCDDNANSTVLKIKANSTVVQENDKASLVFEDNTNISVNEEVKGLSEVKIEDPVLPANIPLPDDEDLENDKTIGTVYSNNNVIIPLNLDLTVNLDTTAALLENIDEVVNMPTKPAKLIGVNNVINDCVTIKDAAAVEKVTKENLIEAFDDEMVNSEVRHSPVQDELKPVEKLPIYEPMDINDSVSDIQFTNESLQKGTVDIENKEQNSDITLEPVKDNTHHSFIDCQTTLETRTNVFEDKLEKTENNDLETHYLPDVVDSAMKDEIPGVTDLDSHMQPNDSMEQNVTASKIENDEIFVKTQLSSDEPQQLAFNETTIIKDVLPEKLPQESENSIETQTVEKSMTIEEIEKNNFIPKNIETVAVPVDPRIQITDQLNDLENEINIVTEIPMSDKVEVKETGLHEMPGIEKNTMPEIAIKEDTVIKEEDIVDVQDSVNKDEEIILSGNNSPFVSLSGEAQLREPHNLEEVENPFATKTRVELTPPSSPKIVSKGYNFNFDEIDDPFATKTKIRQSPTPDTPAREANSTLKDERPLQREVNKNRRKSQPERKKPSMPKKKMNSTYSGSVNVPKNKSCNKTEVENQLAVEEKYIEAQQMQDTISELRPSSPKLSEAADIDFNQPKISTEIMSQETRNQELDKEQSSVDVCDVDTTIEVGIEDNKTSVESLTATSNEIKNTSSSEQSTYYSAGTSSGEGSKNVFNLPEIDDMNFNPFVSKSKIRQSPPPTLNASDTHLNSPQELSTSTNAPKPNVTSTDNPFETKCKMRQSPPPKENTRTCPNSTQDFSSPSETPLKSDATFTENPFITRPKMLQSPPPTSNLTANINITQENPSSSDATQIFKSDATFTDGYGTKDFETKAAIISDDTENAYLSNTTCSSRATDEKDLTVREVHTEDEDTIEGPFLEADDLNTDKMSDFEGEDADMMQFSELPPQITTENVDGDELFIDAEAFEFLLNQNKGNIVADSGKESLFLKFDPLFAKRMSSDGVLAALNKNRQSTPKKMSAAVQMDATFDKSIIAGPSSINTTHDIATSSSSLADESIDDFNVTVSKPMMVVTPAVNPIATPRNRTTTPPSSNRRSITFTSPAIAVIDRLLSLSANNSLIGHDTTVTHMSREQNEADLALTQLRELLAEKEINVYNLRTESKELKDRLSGMESQMRILESESQDRLKKINDLNAKLTEKTKINKSMAAVVEEYERTIASLIAETEQDKKRNNEERIRLIKERDEQTAHLASMEVSFSDLHSKYEKSKQIILTCKANEDAYKKSIKEFEENFTKMQSNYELLKQHATSKLNHANQELEKMNRSHEAEVLKLNAMIKRKDLHITSLEETLAQKTKANEELTAICDELINKVG